MAWTSMKSWLVTPEGDRLPVTARGALIGRGVGADIHLLDPRASRRHALIYLDTEGPRLVQLGRRAIIVNGEPLASGSQLDDGASIQLPGQVLTVQVEAQAQETTTLWVLRNAQGAYLELPTGEISLGGHASDDLHIDGWDPGALRVRPHGDTLTARPVTPVYRNDQRLDPDQWTRLFSGDALRQRRSSVSLLALASSQDTTIGVAEETLPWRVAIQPLPPAGGQVTIAIAKDETTAFIPGLRFDLLQVLLSPSGNYNAGDWLPDAAVGPRVWGRNVPEHPKALTTLVRRLRDDLRRAGIDGAVLERRSWRTRFRLGRHSDVTLLPAR